MVTCQSMRRSPDRMEPSLPDLPTWPLFSPATLALTTAGITLHLLEVNRGSDSEGSPAPYLLAVPALLAALLLPFGLGAHTVCADGVIHYGDRWYLSLAFVPPVLMGFRQLYRRAGADASRAWAAAALIIVLTALAFLLEATLAVFGLFTLCDRDSYTVPAIHLALAGTIALAGVATGLVRARIFR